MKRGLCVLCALLMLVVGVPARADNASGVSFMQQYRGASKATSTKYGKYTSGYWDAALAERYDGLAVAQNPEGYTRHLSNRGCRLFAFAHAVQLLTGEKASADRQLEILAEFLLVDDDPPNAKEVYAAHLVEAYGPSHGVKQVEVEKSWAAAQAHFDQGGVILFNSGGHIALAVDCAEREISGKTEQLVLLVDSAIEATARRVVSGVCYSADFSKTYVKSKSITPAWNAYGRLWIRYSDFEAGSWQACFTSTTAKNLAARKITTLDDQTRIAVAAADCSAWKSPQEGAAAYELQAGDAIRCEGAVKDKDGAIWYCTEDGRYLSAADVKVYAYDDLCQVKALFTAPGKMKRAAPGLDAPVKGVATSEPVSVERFITTAEGDIWALLTDGSYLRYYDLSAGKTEMTFAGLTAGFSLTGVQAPEGDLAKGSRFPLRGVIGADAPILYVEAVILDRQTGQPALEAVRAEPDPMATSLNVNADVNGVNINSTLTFGKLAKGWYTYRVTVQLGFDYQGRQVLIGGAQAVIESDFTVGSPEGEPQSRLPGDADEDGAVTLADAVCILRSGAGEAVAINLRNANVNGDAAADASDALLILQYAAGWNVTLL